MGKPQRWILGTLLLAGVSGQPAAGQTIEFTAGDTASLLSAIEAANAAPTTAHQITFESNITLDRSLVPIAADITFEGAGHRISGADSFQIFFVDSGSTVSINELTFENGNSQGGNGGSRRSGGGLGAGGALFVNQDGAVVLSDVIFENNNARGGRGGDDSAGTAGGGGGGFHGDGGDFGGGGGWYGNGAPDGGGGGGLLGNGDSSEGIGLSGGNGGGKELDGEGGAGNNEINGRGGNGGEFEGGGFGSTGGAGGRFGGGGGSSTRNAGAGGDFGGGGGSTGPLDNSSSRNGGNGGNGGFGGGGGASADGTASNGGFGAGDGVVAGFGGAGSSLGGAVFVRSGGSLTYLISSSGEATTGNSVTAAEAGSGNPEVAGSDLYVMDGVETDVTTSDAAVATTLTGSIGGAGGLRKSGAGMLTLSGNNSYTGGTVVETAGTGTNVLAGHTGSLQGAISVESDALLRFEQENAGTYAGAIDGAGDIEKQGGGTVTLSGSNSYQGKTTVSEGTLVFTSSSLPDTAADIAADATLRFDLGQNASFSGSLTGTVDSHFEKSGSGSLTLATSSAAFAGTSSVTGGELSLSSGVSLGGDLDVASGARLAGTGTASGDVTVSGTLSPGAAETTGSLSLGSLDLQSGGELEIHLTDSASDSIAVTGNASLAANSTLTLFPGAGDYTAGVSYDILTAGGELSGNLTIESSFCLLDSDLNQQGSSLRLTLSRSPTGITECADTSNQQAVAEALSPLLDDPPYFEVEDELFTVPEDELPAALDSMSGEGLAGFQSARLAAATQFLGTLAQRIRDPSAKDTGPAYPLALGFRGPLMPSLGAAAPQLNGSLASSVRAATATASPVTPFSFVSLRGESGLGGFLDGIATFAGIQGDGNSHDTDFNLYGTNAGVDWAFADGALVGAAFGYTRSKLSVTDLATWGSGNTVQGAIYGGYATDLFYVNAVARYGYTQMKTTRRISFGADLYETAKAEFDGTSISGYAEVGLAALELAETYFQPTAAFQYTYVQTDDFVETGAASLNLGVLTPSVHSLISNVGVRIYRPFSMDEEADFIPELRIRYAREFGDTQRPVAARFSPTTGPAPFTVEAAEVGRNLAILGVGWTVMGEGNSSLSLQYDATVNEDILAHTVSVGLLISW